VQAWRPGGGPADSPGWTVRVVPNKFPALRVDAVFQTGGNSTFEGMPGAGLHEVIVETPHHGERLATMDEAGVAGVLRAWQARIRAAKRDARVRYVVVFKNQGALAGATLEHSHSQLMALPLVPEFVGSTIQGARERHAARGRCAFCGVVEEESRAGVRVVEEAAGYLAFTPYASRFPFETWILPRAHEARFEEVAEADLSGLAGRLGSILRRMEQVLDRPAFNLILHSAPFAEGAGPWFHWHVEIVPKLSRMGGFEWGTGFFINLVPPERAAEVLRGAER
jgi:UDPglucose--hexose-1-phosphate uridylyltransferase